jgi:hypothetical protein
VGHWPLGQWPEGHYSVEHQSRTPRNFRGTFPLSGKRFNFVFFSDGGASVIA